MTEDQRTLLEKGCARLKSRAGLIWGAEFIEEFAAAIRSALAEIDALKAERGVMRFRAENTTLKVERDEARREACALRVLCTATSQNCEQIAADRGWDCFEKGER